MMALVRVSLMILIVIMSAYVMHIHVVILTIIIILFNVIYLNVHSTIAKHSQLIEMLNNLAHKCVQCGCFTLV